MLNFYKLKISLRDLSVGEALYPSYILNLMLIFSSYTYGTIIVRTQNHIPIFSIACCHDFSY